MAICKHIVSRDDSIYEAWPSLLLTKSGKMICVFSECTHHGDRTDARITIVTSTDRGRTWTPKRYLTEKCKKDAYWNCARINQLADGRVVISCDFIRGYLDGRDAQVFLWFSEDDGDTWTEPIPLPLVGIVPDKLVELKSGRWIIAAHTKSDDINKLTQYAIYSDDHGQTWSDRITVAKDERYNLCEACMVELTSGELVCFLRENSMSGIDCLKVISTDGGETWSEVINMPIPGCHRPTVGYLADGTLMMTYRFLQGGKGGPGHLFHNLMAAFFTEDTARAVQRKDQHARLMPIDYDRNPHADLGYSGWVQFDDGEIYIVQYIMDDAPKAQIRGYSLRYEEDVLLPQ